MFDVAQPDQVGRSERHKGGSRQSNLPPSRRSTFRLPEHRPR
jgi:hypothetical protein